MDTSGIILAGGKGRRLGRRDKASEIVSHGRLLERVISRISFLEKVIIVTGDSKNVPPELKGTPKPEVVTDIYPGKGPLGGIYSGLCASRSKYNLVVACDMPFLNQSLLRYMIHVIYVSEEYDAAVIRCGNEVEPLHAVYARSCLEPIREMLEKGDLSVHRLFKIIRVRYVADGEIERFDPEHLSFFNINTVHDLELARKISREREP